MVFLVMISDFIAAFSKGPFLTALLNKLEAMKQNSLYVNLQLTGLIARLACYPQPLLSSLLLSHTLVFQPSIKSLMQVATNQMMSYTLHAPLYITLGIGSCVKYV